MPGPIFFSLCWWCLVCWKRMRNLANVNFHQMEQARHWSKFSSATGQSLWSICEWFFIQKTSFLIGCDIQILPFYWLEKSHWGNLQKLAQAALRAPPEVALQCVNGHCYYHSSVFLSFFLSPQQTMIPITGQRPRLLVQICRIREGCQVTLLLAQAALHAPPVVALYE